MSSKAVPMALFMDDSQLASHLYQKDVSEKMYNPSNIDLLLECEDDQSYALPQPNSVINGLQLHTSSNVSMRISFSSCATESWSCRYCQCNFLSEKHLMNHMLKFHEVFESGEEDGDDDGVDFQPEPEDPIADDDEGYDGSADVLTASPEEKHGIVKMDAVVPGLAKTAMTPPNNGVATTPVPSNTNGAYCSPQQTSPVSVPTPQLLENGAAEPKSLKRKASEMPPAPRLTMTIKRSKSSYEIRRDEHSLVPVSPGMQMREENCEVQSDSTNETIDVESSSPHSSPGSEKNDIRAMISGRKNNLVKFFCNLCEKGYVSKYALKRHHATHSDERPFVCSIQGCKGAFKLKSRLTDHIRYVHKRKTPRPVGRSKSMPDTTTSSLAQALLSPAPLSGSGKPSAKTKMFKCTMPNCSREFRDSHNLASHMCLHTGHNPYKCSLCTYSTIQKNSLDWHMQSKHPQS